MFSVQFADISTGCSSHFQGKSEARCKNASVCLRAEVEALTPT